MYLGLDIGTSGIKATVVDESGTIKAKSNRKYPMHGLDKNHRELDPLQVWNETKIAISEILNQIDSSEIDYITTTSLGEAIIPINKYGKPLMRSILGSDIRGEEELIWLCKKIDPNELIQITGLNLSTIYSINKILYIRNHFPDVYKETYKILCFTDFIVYMLTGEFIIDYSMASRTLLFDIHKNDWSKKILDVSEINPTFFSKPTIAGSIAGKVTNSICDEIGLSKNTKVLIGPHDHICNALGAGVVKKGDCSNIIGTTEGITTLLGNKILSVNEISDNNISCEPFITLGTFNTVAWHNTAGALIVWFINTFFKKDLSDSENSNILNNLDRLYKGKPTNLMVLPHFSGSTTQSMDDKAKGAILGLSLSTTREEIYQALIEGACYECLVIIESIEKVGITVNNLIATGGGSKSKTWLSIKADMLGKPIYSTNCPDTGALGAGILAAFSTHIYNSLEEATQYMIKGKKTIYPNEKNTFIYKERFGLYKELYLKTKDYSHILSK